MPTLSRMYWVNKIMRFGETLRRLRKEKALTQSQLAEQIGVSHVYISALEREAKPAPRYQIVVSLAGCLGVAVDELWASAGAEREERLRSRIQGEPTSARVPKRKSVNTNTGFFGISAEISKLAQSLERTEVSEEERELLLAELQLLHKKLSEKRASK